MKHISRRTFINTSTGIIGGSLLAACSSKAASIKKTKDSLGVALVGLGDYATNWIRPALAIAEHAHLAGIVTGSPEKVPVWQEKYGIKEGSDYSYETMHEIANNDDIDVVYIVLPTGLHAKYAIIAANAGKHVWCEKPMAMNTRECQEIIDACNKNNVKLFIGYRMHHEANTQTLISYRDSKPFGNIKSVIAESCYSGGKPRTWRAFKNLGGGAMYDMGVYAVNGIRYATGMDPVEVITAKHIIDRPDIFVETDETTEFQLRFANGLVANGMASVGRRNNQLRVDCDRGWYKLAPMQSYRGVVGERSDGVKLNVHVENQQALQVENDALAILNNSNIVCPGEMGMKDVQIIEAIFEAARTGDSVAID